MRLIDADALSKAMYDEAFENDESYNETNPMARWDSGLWIRYKMFEKCLRKASTIEPNLVINPDEIERGDVVEIGENIVVMHHDDYYDMFLKSELYDDIKPCEDAVSREDAIKQIVNTPIRNQDKGQEYLEGSATRQNEIIDILKSLPSVAPSRPSGGWIPCSERLPEAGVSVIVTSKGGYVYTSNIAHGEWEYGGDVIAWMPLPEPYKESE